MGRWVPGISNRFCATKFSVSLKSIENDAAEASREIRRGIQLDEDLKATLHATLMTIAIEARKNRRFEAAVSAIKLIAGLHALEKPLEINVNGFKLRELAELRKNVGEKKK